MSTSRKAPLEIQAACLVAAGQIVAHQTGSVTHEKSQEKCAELVVTLAEQIAARWKAREHPQAEPG